MEKKNSKAAEQAPIVRKVAIKDTLALIPHGKTVRYHISQMNPQSLRSVAARLNKEAGRSEYSVTLIGNGIEMDVTRN